MKELSPEQLAAVAQATFRKTADIGLKHALANQKYIKKTIADLPADPAGPLSGAIVICAGPSLYRTEPAKILKEVGFPGPVIAVDGAFGYCLRNDIVPDYVVSVDPHPDRIVRWFGDTKLACRKPDSYFRNQDLDDTVAKNECKANDELIALVNKHGKKVKAILSTSVSPDIAERCLESGMEMYWWNPIYDDFDQPGSLTRKLYEINKVPCMVTGGNVGASSFAFAYAVLKKKAIGLLGMDYGYAPETPLHKTQYYADISRIYPDDPAKGYISVYNPYLKETWLTDPAYYWYRSAFLEMAAGIEAGVEIHNCTQGGILFGPGIKFTPFRQFLDMFGKNIQAGPADKKHG